MNKKKKPARVKYNVSAWVGIAEDHPLRELIHREIWVRQKYFFHNAAMCVIVTADGKGLMFDTSTMVNMTASTDPAMSAAVVIANKLCALTRGTGTSVNVHLRRPDTVTSTAMRKSSEEKPRHGIYKLIWALRLDVGDPEDKTDYAGVKDVVAEALIAAMPHGSGFDFDYEFMGRQKNGKWVFETYYTNYDDVGGRDGQTKLRIKIDSEALSSDKLSVTLSEGKAKYRGDFHKSYMWETIQDELFREFDIQEISNG